MTEPFTIKTTPNLIDIGVSLMITPDAHYDLWVSRLVMDPQDAADALRVIADHIEQKIATDRTDGSER